MLPKLVGLLNGCVDEFQTLVEKLLKFVIHSVGHWTKNSYATVC